MTPSCPERLIAARELLQQNRLDAAEAELRAILEEQPRDVSARVLLAATQFRSGRLDHADQLLSELVKDEPAHLDALGLLAVVRRERRDFDGAADLFERLTQLGVGSPDIYNQLGTCRLESGDSLAAGKAFKMAVDLDRANPQSYFNLGLALKFGGSNLEAFQTFKKVIELAPGFFPAYAELSLQMRQAFLWREGLPFMDSGLRRFPDSVQMKVMAATALGKVGRNDEAESLLKQAAAVDPKSGPAYAHWLQEEGRFEDSAPILLDSIARLPLQGQAYYNLAVAKRFEIGGEPLTQAVPKLLGEVEAPDERMFLYYALARAQEQKGDYESAMRHYDLANEHAYRIFNPGVKYDAEAVAAENEGLAKLYGPQAAADLRRYGSSSPMPLFIVGMIRTGTTLLDQILSSHPQVRSAGEQPFWRIRAGRFHDRWMRQGVGKADVEELAAEYLNVLQVATREAATTAAKPLSPARERDSADPADSPQSRPGVTRVTDKMPTNFIHMGLMSLAFPNAKFIHLKRDPLDTCLSIYTTFLGPGTQFAYNQENIVGYYRGYLDTMRIWRSAVPPEQLLEIDYEALVSDKEAVVRRVLEFCGLEWDDACLSHESNRSQVSTPSLWTARQPVNTGSVERWRRFEPWLGKLAELRCDGVPGDASV